MPRHTRSLWMLLATTFCWRFRCWSGVQMATTPAMTHLTASRRLQKVPRGVPASVVGNCLRHSSKRRNRPIRRVTRWRAVFLEMQREFAEVGAEGITEDAARAWVHGLISADRSALTVREIWLSASRRVFRWAREHKRIRQNPFAEVRVDVPRKVQTREGGKAFTDDEVRTILNASLQYSKPARQPRERAAGCRGFVLIRERGRAK